MDPDTQILTGLIPIEAALMADYRAFHRLAIDQDMDTRKVAPLVRLAKKAGVTVERCAKADLARLAAQKDVAEDAPGKPAGATSGATSGGEGKNFRGGGAVAVVGPKRMIGLDELMTTDDGVAPLVVMLDGVEDPYNFGHAVRALWAAGVSGLVTRPRNWFEAAPLIARASAGATELIPTAMVDTAEDALNIFKVNHFATVATSDRPEAVDVDQVDLTGGTFLLIGGEHRGIGRSVLKQADTTVKIPYGREFGLSLGTVAAAAVIGFESLRQRRDALGPPDNAPTRPKKPTKPQ